MGGSTGAVRARPARLDRGEVLGEAGAVVNVLDQAESVSPEQDVRLGGADDVGP